MKAIYFVAQFDWLLSLMIYPKNVQEKTLEMTLLLASFKLCTTNGFFNV